MIETGTEELSEKDVTELLIDLSNGNTAAVETLLPVVYNELRRLAASYLRHERVATQKVTRFGKIFLKIRFGKLPLAEAKFS